MSSPRDVAAGFSITGLLDQSSKTRERYPVVEIEVSAIADHPANVAYSMDDDGIRKLAASIAENGLTDIPLVRKMADGSWQMISGHRRKAAFRMLSEDDPAYAKMPCRVIEDISDEQAVTLLHTANYFVRALTITERAAATSALGMEVKLLREKDESLAGVRTEDIKARIIESQTGRKVSGKTIQREERLARKIAENLIPEWAKEADSGNLTAKAIDALCGMTKPDQSSLYERRGRSLATKKLLSDFVVECAGSDRIADPRLAKARQQIVSFFEEPRRAHRNPVSPGSLSRLQVPPGNRGHLRTIRCTPARIRRRPPGPPTPRL